MNTLKDFYEYIKVNHNFNCVNTLDNGIFSKNIFIKRYDDLLKYVVNNRYKNCYINYQPLKTSENRKTENVRGVNLIAFDIECKNKKSPESSDNLIKMLDYIYKFLYYTKTKNYMIVFSGNGYHLYMSIGRIIKRDDLELLKQTYKQIIKDFSNILNKISNDFINSDDRKDLAGILRIPETTNVKVNRFVKLIDIKQNGDNILLRKKFFQTMRQIKRKNKIFEEKMKENKNINIKLPNNIDELLDHPLVKILFDKTLPEKTFGSRHTSIIFALQSLIYHSGLQNKYEITELSREVNQYCGISVDLSSCSNIESFNLPLQLAINFCKKNRYDKYVKELEELYK